MRFSHRRFLHLAAVAAALPAISPVAFGQAYPSRSITMVVPTAAGGAMDTFARFMAERMRVSLGQPVIIESVGGANGNIGVGRVARAARRLHPDRRELEQPGRERSPVLAPV